MLLWNEFSLSIRAPTAMQRGIVQGARLAAVELNVTERVTGSPPDARSADSERRGAGARRGELVTKLAECRDGEHDDGSPSAITVNCCISAAQTLLLQLTSSFQRLAPWHPEQA